MISLFVTIDIKPGCQDAFLAATRDNHQNALKEPGCQVFDVLADESIPTRFYLYERYLDQAAIDAHRASDHFKRWDAAMGPLMANPRNRVRMTHVMPV